MKRNSILKLGDWTIGEDRASGALVVFKKETLQVFVDKDGGVFTTAQQGYLKQKGHALRHPGVITKAIGTQEQDCTVATWGTWTACSRPCGGGSQNRNREVVQQERNGGAECPQLTESRPCLQSFHGDLDSCPTDCVVGDWSAWAECTAICGGGRSQRQRNVTSYPSSRGVTCPSLYEEKSCNTDLCGAQLCTSLDAAFAMNPKKPHEVVITAGDNWISYDMNDAKVLQGPAKLADPGSWFKGFPLPFASQIDSAVATPSGETVVFSHGADEEGIDRNQWLLYDTSEMQVARGPYEMPANGNFDTLLDPFNKTIDAALQASGNEAYLFSADQWLLFDLVNKSIVEGPYNINETPSLNMPAPFNANIDASISDSDGTAILFSGHQWLRWDTTARQVTEGPFSIADHPKFQPLISALNVCAGFDLRKLGDLYTKLTKLRPVPTGKTSRIFKSYDVGSKDGDSKEAQFNAPLGLAPLEDVMYVADAGNHAIRKFDLKSHETTTVAGGSILGGRQDGTGAEARFNAPSGITAVRVEGTDLDGDLLYVADTDNHAIRRLWIPFGATEATVTTVAGGGHASCEQCDSAQSVAASSELAQCRSCCDCKSEVLGFRDDENGKYAKFAEPTGLVLAYEPTGGSIKGKNEVVYVADKRNNAIRQLILSPGQTTAQVSTIAGGQKMLPSMKAYSQVATPYQWGHGFGLNGFADGVGSDAMFNGPTDLALVKLEDKHVLYVADSHNNRVARVEVNMVLVDGTPTEEIPILAIRDSSGNSVGAIRSVPVGSEYQWDTQQQVWDCLVHSDLTAVSICSLAPVALPQTFEFTLGGEYNVIGLFMQWGPEGQWHEFQVAVYDGTQWHEVIAKTGVPMLAMEQVELPEAAQQLVVQAVRLSISASRAATINVPSIHLMGKLVALTVSSRATQVHATSTKSCEELGWAVSPAGADAAVQENGCGTQLVSDAGSCLHVERHNVAANNLTAGSGKMNFSEAESTCSALGARLCRIEEIQGWLAADTGCGLEQKPVWSSSVCGCGGVLSQPSKIDLEAQNGTAARVCSSVDDFLDVQCCADGPPVPAADTAAADTAVAAAAPAPAAAPADANVSAQILLQLTEDTTEADAKAEPTETDAKAEPTAASIIEAASSTALKTMRFTNGTGSIKKDLSCVLPFILDGHAYNDCTTQPTAGGEQTGEDGWCPVQISTASDVDDQQDGMLVVSADSSWGVCAPTGYIPLKCVMSPWSGWNRCSVLCGGGSRSRHRRVVEQYDDATCGATDEMGSCNAHQCGSVKTVAGGRSSKSGRIGLGFRNTPLNPQWMSRAAGRQPDLHFDPFRIDVLKQQNTDVLYVMAKPRGRADHVSIIRQIDVTSSTPEIDGGTGVPDGCVDMANYTDSDSIPTSVAQCRVITNSDGTQLTAEVIGSGVESEGAMSVAATKNNRIYTSLVSNSIASVDLAPHLPCRRWMSSGLEGWELDNDGAILHQTTTSMLLKTSHHGEPKMWDFQAMRLVGSLVSVGLDERYETDAHGKQRTFQKNTLCSTEKKTDVAAQKQCCVTKDAMVVNPPRECPSPVTPECRLEWQIDQLDFEYANGLISKSLWI